MLSHRAMPRCIGNVPGLRGRESGGRRFVAHAVAAARLRGRRLHGAGAVIVRAGAVAIRRAGSIGGLAGAAVTARPDVRAASSARCARVPAAAGLGSAGGTAGGAAGSMAGPARSTDVAARPAVAAGPRAASGSAAALAGAASASAAVTSSASVRGSSGGLGVAAVASAFRRARPSGLLVGVGALAGGVRLIRGLAGAASNRFVRRRIARVGRVGRAGDTRSRCQGRLHPALGGDAGVCRLRQLEQVLGLCDELAEPSLARPGEAGAENDHDGERCRDRGGTGAVSLFGHVP
jgi:hypothetical protein